MFAKGVNISLEDKVLNTIPEIDILNFYLGIKEVPCVINSPLRVDNNPSFGLRVVDNEKIKYLDFATEEHGGVISLFMNYFHLSYWDTLEKIYTDMGQGYEKNESLVLKYSSKNKLNYSNNKELKCCTRGWKDYDLSYWESFGISLPWLKFGNVHPISHIILEDLNKKERYCFVADKYAYVYVEFKDNIQSLKIYQPFSTTHKWHSKHNCSVWDLWQQLPDTGANLIITSSRKDALCIWENTGIPSTGLQSETTNIKEQVINELKARFKNIYILYDNDFDKEKNWGQLFGSKLAELYNLKQITIPDELGVKDSSDLCKKYGREFTRKTILKLIKNG